MTSARLQAVRGAPSWANQMAAATPDSCSVPALSPLITPAGRLPLCISPRLSFLAVNLYPCSLPNHSPPHTIISHRNDSGLVV